MTVSDPGSWDALPLTVLVPEDASGCIEIYDQHAALKIAVVERAGVHLVGDEWDAPGAYVLLDRPDADEQWGVYAGKAPAGVRTRLRDHLRNKDHWYRALLLRRDTTLGFNSAQIGWLEGRLYDLFDVATDAVLHNGNRPSDETLPPYDRQMLEMVVLPVRRVLRMLGHDPRTVDDNPPPSAPRTKQYHGIKMPQLLSTGVLQAGARLTSTNGAWPGFGDGDRRCGDRVRRHRLREPVGRSRCGEGRRGERWDFWAVETDSGKVPLSVLRERCREILEAAAAETP
ncbi:MAG: hypothetical protein V9E94_19235 [Microthrixaceae bacterium]